MKVDPLFYGTTTYTHFNIHSSEEQGAEFWFISVCLVFAVFSLPCMLGLTNALEQSGFISAFMGFYLKMVRWLFSSLT